MNLLEQLKQHAKSIFGDGEFDAFFSPGRVNLIGEHTDYNGGHVFPCALTMGTYGVIRLRDDKRMLFSSMNKKGSQVVESTLDQPIVYDAAKGWANYLIGVVAKLMERGCVIPCGFEVAITGDIPNGAGLSSSASIEVLMGTMLNTEFSLGLTPTEIALISQKSENEFNGMNCGIMDQFAVANGKKDHAMFLDTNTLECAYAPVKLDDAIILITNSNVKHSLVTSAYNDRRRESSEALEDLKKVYPITSLGMLSEEEFDRAEDQIADPVNRKRAKHAVYENQRTIKAVAALEKGDLETFGKLMNASHISLRDDYEVSCPEVDALVEAQWKIPGVLGARITGGGFGGCTVAIVRKDAVEQFRREVPAAYKKATGLEAVIYEAGIGDGARALEAL